MSLGNCLKAKNNNDCAVKEVNTNYLSENEVNFNYYSEASKSELAIDIGKTFNYKLYTFLNMKSSYLIINYIHFLPFR